MPQFPLILIPDAITQVKAQLPPLPQLPAPQSAPLPQPPQPLGAEPQRISRLLVASKALAFSVVSAAFGVLTALVSPAAAPIVGLLILLVCAGRLGRDIREEVRSFPRRKRTYEQQQRFYWKQQQKYQQAQEELPERVRQCQAAYKEYLQKRQELKDKHHSPEAIAAFQREQLLKILSQTTPHDGHGSRALQGRAEASFGQRLNHYFPSKIYKQLKVQNPEYKKRFHYTPDFAYIDAFLNLYIDIEIDEPYNKEGKPIHFIGSATQRARNKHFQQRGWIVIRFSEEQVVRWPDSCCKTVAETIANITNTPLILKQFDGVVDLKPMQQWTEHEALEMAQHSYREQYLQ